MQKGATEDKMVVWHLTFSGHEFEQDQGDSEGHGKSLILLDISFIFVR